jgi:hypothetical protein
LHLEMSKNRIWYIPLALKKIWKCQRTGSFMHIVNSLRFVK